MDGSAASTSQAQLLHLQSFSPENVQHNAKQLYYIRSVVTSVAGSAAGVLGLTNLHGFYFYFASLIATNLLIFAITIGFQPRRYLLSFNPARDPAKMKREQQATSSAASTTPIQFLGFLIEGLQEMAFGYVLWWTLWTAIIHVYD